MKTIPEEDKKKSFWKITNKKTTNFKPPIEPENHLAADTIRSSFQNWGAIVADRSAIMCFAATIALR